MTHTKRSLSCVIQPERRRGWLTAFRGSCQAAAAAADRLLQCVCFVASLTHHPPVSHTVVGCRRQQHYREARIGFIVCILLSTQLNSAVPVCLGWLYTPVDT